jgi:BRCA1-associated protein
LERAVEKASKASAAADRAEVVLDAMTQKFTDLSTQYSEALENIENLEKNLDRTSKKVEKTDVLAKKLAKDWKEEKTMNEALSEKIRFLDGKIKESEKKCEELQAEKADLEEQNRDLSFFITGGEKLKELKEAGEDVEGTIEVGTSKRRKGKGKK